MGYVVALIDGRGSDGRGLQFEGRIKHNMGQIEIQDQVCLVKYLIKNGYTDKNKVALTGGSYGGYMSLLGLCQRPDIFKIVVSIAPVVKWELYDTGYTERYMGTPQKQKNAYTKGSITYYAKGFPNEENRLVIVHGLTDENVHFFHTSSLLTSLINLDKPYTLKVFPGERHGIRQYKNIMYLEKYIIKHLNNYL